MSFNLKLIDLLGTNPKYVDEEGELLLTAVQDHAWKLDHDLIKMLLTDEEIRNKFFDEINGYWIFNQNTFIEYISQKNFLDNSYTRFRNRIGLTIADKYLDERGEVSLVWPYKDTVLEGGQTKEEEKRNEVFFNEILAQDDINRLFDFKVLTNLIRYTTKGKVPVSEIMRNEEDVICENLIIKGNNLIALHTLQSQFMGQVKFIYIDPPYNTGSDSFGYNNNFNHSSLLTFMRNRLTIAKKLLSKKGVIVVHCDYVEEHYLKVMMDEIFGRDNFINSISIRDSHPSGLKLSSREKTIIKTKSTMLVYKKTEEARINPIYQRRHDWDIHFNTYVDIDSESLERKNLQRYIMENKIIKNKEFVLDERALTNIQFREFAFQNRHKIFQSTKELPDDARKKSLKHKDNVIEYSKGEFAYNGRRLSPLSKSIYNVGFDGYEEEDFAKLLCDFWDDIDFNNLQSEGGISFPSGKKPELLLARLITMFTNNKDIVLDYFMGSGSTVAVAHKMGRQYIGIEQLEYNENDSVIRLTNVINGDKSGISKFIDWQGGGNFIYCELMKYNESFIEKIQKAKNGEELIKIWKGISEHSFLNWYINPELPEEAINDFVAIGKDEHGLEKQKKLLIELLDKNQLYVNLSEIDDERFAVSEEDKQLNKEFYQEL